MAKRSGSGNAHIKEGVKTALGIFLARPFLLHLVPEGNGLSSGLSGLSVVSPWVSLAEPGAESRVTGPGHLASGRTESISNRPRGYNGGGIEVRRERARLPVLDGDGGVGGKGGNPVNG